MPEPIKIPEARDVAARPSEKAQFPAFLSFIPAYLALENRQAIEEMDRSVADPR